MEVVEGGGGGGGEGGGGGGGGGDLEKEEIIITCLGQMNELIRASKECYDVADTMFSQTTLSVCRSFRLG